MTEECALSASTKYQSTAFVLAWAPQHRHRSSSRPIITTQVGLALSKETQMDLFVVGYLVRAGLGSE